MYIFFNFHQFTKRKESNHYESEKSHPPRRTCPADRYPHQQHGRCFNAALRLRHFRYFQRPLRIFPCISDFDPWHLDLYFPGTSCFKPDDPKKTLCSQLFSFVAGFAFGKMVDIHEIWINTLPLTIPLRVFYFVASYLILCFGIALSNRCKLPVIPTDLFPRDLSEIIKKPYSKVKITFDVTCLFVTACMTFLCLGHISGLGIGTGAAAFTMGKTIGVIGDAIDKKVEFVSVLSK